MMGREEVRVDDDGVVLLWAKTKYSILGST